MITRYLNFILILLVSLLGSNVHAERVFTIGIVLDGQMEQAGWTQAQFENELRVLTRGEFDIHFPKTKQLDGKWSAKRITMLFKQLQSDPEVDMVLTMGYVASAIAALSENLSKPTFSPFVMDADLLGLPRKGNTSGVRNLNYLTGDANFVRDLEVFHTIVPFQNLAVLIDQTIYEAQTKTVKKAQEVVAAAGLNLHFILQTEQDEDLASKLPKDIDAVVLTSLPRLGPSAMKRLINALIEKRIPAYSLPGSHLVEQGILMSEAPASDWQRLARRNALNMHAVMRGEIAENQPVAFKGKRHLTLNMATARAIGLSPRYDVLRQAILLHEEPTPTGRPLSLSTVAHEAVRVNLDLRATALGLEGSKSEIDKAQARLLPQLGASIGYTRLNDSRINVISGAVADQSTKARLTLSQLIYSDRLRSNVQIQQYLQNNREALYRQLELDIIQEATLSYLNILKAQTQVHIRRENTKLTRTNYRLAQERQQLGVGNPAEVYRWESQLATAKKELLSAQAQYQQARDSLNRLLHRPINDPFITTSATLDDPSLLVSRKEVFDYVNNNRAFKIMTEFLVNEALNASPALASLDELILASQLELRANQRAYWSPTITLDGELSNIMNEDRQTGLSAEGDTDWSVGLNVSIPLYEGGARRARVTGSRLELEQNNVQRNAAAERIEQNLRSALHQIKASYPSIQLSREAEVAARKNLKLVTDAYTRGTLTILDLLDAQNAALVAKESATNTIFTFLIDLMNLQRHLGRFDFFLDQTALDDWLDRLRKHIYTSGGG